MFLALRGSQLGLYYSNLFNLVQNMFERLTSDLFLTFRDKVTSRLRHTNPLMRLLDC